MPLEPLAGIAGRCYGESGNGTWAEGHIMQNIISEENSKFMAAVLQGLCDLDEGREMSLTEACLLLSQDRLVTEQSPGDKRN